MRRCDATKKREPSQSGVVPFFSHQPYVVSILPQQLLNSFLTTEVSNYSRHFQSTRDECTPS